MTPAALLYQRRLEAIIRRVENYVPRAWVTALESGDPPAWWWENAYPVLLAASEAAVDLSGGLAAARLGDELATSAAAADAIDRRGLYAGVRILQAHGPEEAAKMGAQLAGQHSRDVQWTAGRALDAFRPPGRKMRRTPNSTACDFCRNIAGQAYTKINEVSVHEYCRCGWDYLDADDPRNVSKPRPRQRR